MYAEKLKGGLTLGTRLTQILSDLFKNNPNQSVLDRARKKFLATHTLVTELEPSIVTKDSSGQKQYHTMNHMRKVKTPDGKVIKEKVTVPVWKFTGYDYGKKYTGEKLRAIRKQQTEDAIRGKTRFTDGTPIIYSGGSNV